MTASVAPGLPGVADGDVAWGDYDNDGRLDFLLTGYSYNDNFRRVSQVWRNTGNGFTNVTDTVAPGLPGVGSGSIAWGDYPTSRLNAPKIVNKVTVSGSVSEGVMKV